jgi:hypothetical protein
MADEEQTFIGLNIECPFCRRRGLLDRMAPHLKACSAEAWLKKSPEEKEAYRLIAKRGPLDGPR